jgi:hypothetical protein
MYLVEVIPVPRPRPAGGTWAALVFTCAVMMYPAHAVCRGALLVPCAAVLAALTLTSLRPLCRYRWETAAPTQRTSWR